MPLTKSFKELVRRRVADDPEFAAALLREYDGTATAENAGTVCELEQDSSQRSAIRDNL
jgi:hypothetical protein